MKLTATLTPQRLDQMIENSYGHEVLSKVSTNRWQNMNILVSNTIIDWWNIHMEKYWILATITDSEPLGYWDSIMFSNVNLKQFSIVSDQASLEFYLT